MTDHAPAAPYAVAALRRGFPALSVTPYGQPLVDRDRARMLARPRIFAGGRRGSGGNGGCGHRGDRGGDRGRGAGNTDPAIPVRHLDLGQPGIAQDLGQCADLRSVDR